MVKIHQKHPHLWHPCGQMKDYETFPPLKIQSAHGSYLFTEDGHTVIDAISSWWCKSLGHGHPFVKAALKQQIDKFEHVLLANTTNDAIEQLSSQLAELSENLNKVTYASDGSCAVEIAMKMSLHAHQIQGQSQRTRFITLKNSYHGETAGAMSVSDVGRFRQPYEAMLFNPVIIENLPYVKNRKDPLWQDCSAHWPSIELQLKSYYETATALIVEPIVQGAGGMLIYSQDFLRRLRHWTQQHNIHLIADEIMTGLGRTGLPLACQHANVEPDFICLSKALTAGWLPLSAVITREAIYQWFYDDYGAGKEFLHSHTHTGNALAASTALAALSMMSEENIYQKVSELEPTMATLFQEVADNTKKITNIRYIGGIVAGDLVVPNKIPRAGYAVYQRAVELGALLRPLGNTLYWAPPLNVDENTLRKLQIITEQAIVETL